MSLEKVCDIESLKCSNVSLYMDLGHIQVDNNQGSYKYKPKVYGIVRIQLIVALYKSLIN